MERDLSAWKGNPIQESALTSLYNLESKVKDTHDERLISAWRKLQTSDHFYYMCTKYFSDGDVHKYFNPYESPYESYINLMNILDDLNTRCSEVLVGKKLPINISRKRVLSKRNNSVIDKVVISERI